MKILQVGSGLHGWAGIERYVLYLREGLAGRGHSVDLSVSPGTPLAEAVETRSVTVPLRGKFDLRAFVAYRRLFRSRPYDVIHTHFNPDFLIVAYAAGRSRKSKLVMTRHVALPWARVKAVNFARLYDRIIPVSCAVERKLAESGVPAAKMRVAKAGCPALAARGPLPDLGGGFNMGFIGRLAPEKGIRVLIEAARLLPEGLSFHVFGDGPLRGEVEQASGGSLLYHGFRQDIPECLAAVDAVAIPSVWEEAFPYAALEAMSVGRAIVASDIGGLPELVQDGVNGVLYPAGNAAALAEVVVGLSSQPDRVRALGDRGREIHRSDYTIEKMAERVEGVYGELLGG